MSTQRKHTTWTYMVDRVPTAKIRLHVVTRNLPKEVELDFTLEVSLGLFNPFKDS